jgi:hypothetical protein
VTGLPSGHLSTSGRRIRALDTAAAAWSLLWLLGAIAIGHQVWQLSAVTDPAEATAQAVNRVGQALQRLGQVPLIGGAPAQLGARVRAAAGDITSTVAQTDANVHRLGILIGLFVFLLPTLPVIVGYLPLRLRRQRELAALTKRLQSGSAEGLAGYLAFRALSTMSFAELSAVTPDPVGDVRQGRYDALAGAELRRLGVRQPQGRR